MSRTSSGSMIVLAACLAALAAQVPLVHGSSSVYVTEEDYEIVSDAQRVLDEQCDGGFKGSFNEDSAYCELDQASGGRNFFVEVMQESEDTDDIVDNATEKMRSNVGAITLVVFGFIMLILTVVLCCGLTMSGCPCCKCCRPCRKERGQAWLLTKLLAAILCLLILGGVIIAHVVIMAQMSRVGDGVDNVACTSANMVKKTFDGTENFVGILGLLSELESLQNSLKPDSPFLTEVRGIVDDTQSIDDAVTITAETLQLLSDMLAEPVNQEPVDNGGNSLLHKCTGCQFISDLLNPVISDFESSVATALSDAREEADKQLTEEETAQYRQSLVDASEPVDDLKTLLRDSFKIFLEEKTYDDMEEVVGWVARSVNIFLLVPAYVLVLASLLALGLWLCRETKGEAASAQQEYARSVPRLACCSWCCGMYTALLAFFVGGWLMVVSFPLSTVCITVIGIDGQTVLDIARPFDIDTEGDAGESIKDVVDNCIALDSRGSDTNLLDIVFTREDGEKVTFKERLQDETVKPLQDEFDSLADSINSYTQSGQDLSNDPVVIALRNFLRDTPIKALINSDDALMKADARFSAASSSWFGFDARSLACENYTVQGIFTEGVEHLVFLQNDAYQSGAGFAPCSIGGGAGDCTSPAGVADAVDCQAGLDLISLKGDLYDAGNKKFRCDVFMSNGVECDVLNMQQAGNSWTNDCLTADSTLVRMTRECTLEEYNTYIAEFDVRIEKALQRVDWAILQTADQINTTLRESLDTYIIDPVNNLLDSAQCSFMADLYDDTVSGFCYQVVAGFYVVSKAYLAVGFLAIAGIVVMYMVWRRTYDNIEASRADGYKVSNV